MVGINELNRVVFKLSIDNDIEIDSLTPRPADLLHTINVLLHFMVKMQNAFIFRIFISYCVINCALSNSISGWSSCPLAASPKTPRYLFISLFFFFFFCLKIMHLFARAYIFAMSNANLHNKFVPFIVSIYIR